MSTKDTALIDRNKPAASDAHTIRMSPDEIALFADADGTLLDIALTPDAVEAPPGLVDSLDRAFDALDGAFAIVSGRSIEDIDSIFAPVKLPASGVHGAQIRPTRDGAIVDVDPLDVSREIAGAMRAITADFEGALVEDKRSAIAIHWRACPQREAEIYDRIVRALPTHGAPLIVMRGHFVFEVKSAETSKGGAVREFMQRAPFAGRRPVFIGDDVTDVAGMAAAKLLGGLAFAVSAPLPGADAVFADPGHVRAWLSELGRGGRRPVR